MDLAELSNYAAGQVRLPSSFHAAVLYSVAVPVTANCVQRAVNMVNVAVLCYSKKSSSGSASAHIKIGGFQSRRGEVTIKLDIVSVG